MDRERLAARLLATFLDELDEQVTALDAELLALEEAPADAGRLRAVFRIAHTLKGAARAADVPAVEALCHALEGMLAGTRDGGAAVTGAQIALLFAAADALRDAGARVRAGRPLHDAPVTALLAQVRARQPLAGPATPARAADTSPAATANAGRPAAAGAAIVGAAGGTLVNAEGTPDAPIATGVASDGAGAAGAGAASGLEVAPPGVAPPAAPAASAPESPHPERRAGDRTGDRMEPLRVDVEKLEAIVEVASDLLALAANADARAADAESAADALARTVRARRRAGAAQRPAARVAERAADRMADRPTDAPDGDDPLLAAAARAERLARAARRDAHALGRAAAQLTGGVRRLRLRPVADLTERLPRVVRDLAVSLGKDVGLAVRGADVEADRAVLDALRDPVLHLLRNAVDHGIESPEARARAGKPARGTVMVAASLVGDRLRLEVRDDGAGVNEAAVRAAVARRGRPAPADTRAVAEALFEGGVSSREQATTISGRGVGLDVVRAAVERLGGTVEVGWEAGAGTWFVLETPVTLAALRVVLVEVGAQRLGVPSGVVERVLRVSPDDLRAVDGRAVLPADRVAGAASADGPPVPVATLARLLGPPLPDPREGARVPALLLAAGAQRTAVLVDRVIGEQEVVVRPIEHGGPAVAHRYAGAAALADGLVLVVNAAAVLAGAGGRAGEGVAWNATQTPAARPRHVLVADDSITTRALEESVLSAAGYAVTTAIDGADAWRRVQAGGVDLLVSDVEMPHMDGFTLCATVRASERFAALPVILVTSLDTPEHRARGLEAGADAYLTKSSFDQDALLETVAQLLGAPAPGTRP